MSLKFSINDRCTACLACVRVCPVEAIAVDGSEIGISDAACIECGICVPACHHDAIDVVGDVARVRGALEERRAVLILPAEAAVYFYPATPEQIINACFAAGFAAVHFDSLGDELVAREYLRIWRDDPPETWIRSTSPVVVEYCRSRHPELLPYLAPVVTPPVALARYLRQQLPDGYEVVYAGLATPGANGTGEEIKACISYEELKSLLEEADAAPRTQPLTLQRIPSERRRHLSIAGGLPRAMLEGERLSSRRFRTVRSLAELRAVGRALGGGTHDRGGADARVDRGPAARDAGDPPTDAPAGKTKGVTGNGRLPEADGMRRERRWGESLEGPAGPLGFVDALPFDGNLNHPALGPPEDYYWRKTIAELAEPGRSDEPVVDPAVEVDLSAFFEPKDPALPPASEEEVAAVLDRIGRAPNGRYWNCGACGHPGCIEFARAAARGRASLAICPYYLGGKVEQANKDARHDALTGLFTYGVLQERLEEEVARANRAATALALALLFVDLDEFKPLNDAHGHALGNDVLRGVARVLESAIRATDIACRFGGDEFVLILVNADPDGAARVAEQIRHQVERLEFPTPGGTAGVTLSIGLAYHSGTSRSVLTAEALMAEADASLYVAKAHGGNTVHPAVGGELVHES